MEFLAADGINFPASYLASSLVHSLSHSSGGSVLDHLPRNSF